MINVLSETESEVEESQGKFVSFFAKYVFLVSSKSLYELSQTDDLFEDLYYEYCRMIDYVIEFGFGGKINIRKGDEQKFFNMEWDMRFESNECEYYMINLIERFFLM